MKDIEQKYEHIIDELKEIESKCKQNVQNKESSNKLEKKTRSIKVKLIKWIEALELNLNRGNYCENISNDSFDI